MRRLGGWPFRRAASRVDVELTAALHRLLPPAPTVAVLAPAGDDEVAALVARVRPDARVVSYDVGLDVRERHGALTAAAPWDAIVDAGPPRGQLRRVLASYYQLRPGGVLVLRATDPKTGRLLDGHPDEVKVRSPDEPADVTRLAASLGGSGRFGRGAYLVRGDGPVAWAILDEDNANRLLERRPEVGRVLQVVPAQTFNRRAELRTNTAENVKRAKPLIRAPAAALREYDDALVAPQQVVVREGLVLPDTFRHNARARLTHRRIEEVAWLFGRVKTDLSEAVRIEGVHYHLDNELRGHFGHLLTEQVARYWGWAPAKERYPDLKAVVMIRRTRELGQWEYDLLEAAGIARDDVLFLRGPARFEKLVSAAPLFSNPEYVHPAITATWDSVGDALATRSTLTDLPRRIFIGRRTDKRACRNGAALEERFAADGFTLVYPEEHSIADQVALFRRAEAIAGYVGSGMFTMCFVKEPVPVITIGSSRYSPRNEYLIAAARGHPLTMVTSRPDDESSYNSSYEFDFAHEGRFLDEVLAELD